MVLDFVKLSDNYPIMCLNGTWETRDITGAECLQMAETQNANNNGFLLIPTNYNNSIGYSIVTFKIAINSAYLADEDSGLTNIGGYNDNYIGYKESSDITRPDLRMIRLLGSSGLTPNYSGNSNGYQKTYDNVNYRFFVINSYSSAPIHPLIYLPASVTEIYVNNAPLVIYNWVSVPSVSGKNGILSLAQIASGSINDGEPVSDAAATAFSDLPAECNVGEIIDDLLPYEESLVDVLVKYKVKGAVTGAFDYVKLVAKKGSIPKSVEDGDKVVDINPSKKSKLVTDLDEGSKYYFVIFEKDSAGQTAQSSEKSITTGDLPEIGGEFTYSGEVEEFEVPVSGVYRLETWGAQGADATSGSNMARGGYGAYSVGEMFLKKGDILYVNVGGQNGYGGAN